MEEIKKALAPILTSLKDLNIKMGKNEVDGDFLISLATKMKLSALQIEQYTKKNKIQIKGGVKFTPPIEDEDE
jgi:hypothetical protein